MAAFNRPTSATYETHENVTIDTLGMNRKLCMRFSIRFFDVVSIFDDEACSPFYFSSGL